MDIGKNIAAYRKAKNMTQDELGKRLGVSNQAVSKWESGVSMPDIMLLPVIAKALDITLDAIYGIEPLAPTEYKVTADNFPEVAFNELLRLFFDSTVMRFTGVGASDKEQIQYIMGRLKEGAYIGCISNTGGSVLLTDSFSFIDQTYKLPESEKIFSSIEITGILKHLTNKNLRKVLGYEYRVAFEKSKSDNSRFRIDDIMTGCNLSEEEAEEALILLKQLGLNEILQRHSRETEYIFLMSNGIYALAIFKLAGMMAEDKCWTVVRDTSLILDYAFKQ